MSGGNGSRDDRELHRLIEAGFDAVPKGLRKEYEHDDLVNELYLMMKSRGVREPKKFQIRLAAIDIHRRNTHYPRVWNHPHHRKVHPRVEHHRKVPDKMGSDNAGTKAEIAEALRDVRRRFGTDGLAVFLMTRIMGMDARSVARIMDFEPDSALGKSLTSIGGD